MFRVEPMHNSMPSKSRVTSSTKKITNVVVRGFEAFTLAASL
jgi:hypothetical protein